ncbi:FDLD family class I lanthipeptide [Paenibacillus sp. SI8]
MVNEFDLDVQVNKTSGIVLASFPTTGCTNTCVFCNPSNHPWTWFNC